MTEISDLAKKHELWRRGILHWKCHSVQKEMYEIFESAPGYSTLFWLLARQTGKSYLLALLALQQCLKEKNSIVKLLTDTKIHVETIFLPLFRELLDDCPEELKPTYHKKDYVFRFPNGSEIQLAGSDNGHYERLRGQKSHLVLIDEAGFCSKLRYIVKSVLLPTLTHTKGKLILATTPALEPDHQSYHFIEVAEMKDMLSKKTIYDNPLLEQDQIDSIIEECGGVETEDFRREYLCERIRSEDNVVFPELTEEFLEEIVTDWDKPPFYHTYEGMDLGFKDLTAVVFGYYDFRSDKIIIEDELVLKGSQVELPKLVETINEIEEKRWTNILTNEVSRPLVRVSDHNLIVLQEISRISGGKVAFQPARKDDNGAAINNLRMMLANKKIIIHPRCVNLIRHLRNCQWKDSGTKLAFSRSADNGHYDAVDALKYMIRHIAYTQNPYPADYQLDVKNMHFRNGQSNYFKEQSGQIQQINVFKKIFNIKGNK